MMKAKLHWVTWTSVCVLGAVVGCADAADDGANDGTAGTMVTAPLGNAGNTPVGGAGSTPPDGDSPVGGTGTTPPAGGGDTPPSGGTDGNPPTGGDVPGAEPAVSYAESVEPIMLANCVAACHTDGGNGGPNGFHDESALDLSEGVGFTALTTGASLQTGQPFIGATPEESYLWAKLNLSPPMGLSMPFGTLLPEAQRETIRAWIAGGAAP